MTEKKKKSNVVAEICQAVRDDNVNRFCNLITHLSDDDKTFMSKDTWHDFEESPLHVAALLGRTDYFLPIIQAGASVHAKARSLEDHYETPLHTAVAKQNPEAVRILMKLGSDPEAPGSRTHTLLRDPSGAASWAEKIGNKDVIYVFERFEANRKQSDGLLKIMLVIFLLVPISSYILFKIVGSSSLG